MPSWVDYDPTKRQVRIFPQTAENTGTYLIDLILTEGIAYKTSTTTFSVTVNDRPFTIPEVIKPVVVTKSYNISLKASDSGLIQILFTVPVLVPSN